MSDDILFETRGRVGLVTLNRPQALNALTHGMVRALAPRLEAWAGDPAIGCVVVTGAGGRAFSAGGDIRHLYELGRAGRFDEALAFWWDEYRLNLAIKRYPKPYVALIDGIVMGGGVGVSINGSHRVAGERFSFAMPEVGIGFFPDVGATFFLPRMPGESGTYCALTGARLKRGDAITAGIANYALPGASFEGLIGRLAEGEPVEAAISALAIVAEPPALLDRRAIIDRCFAGDDVAAILARLDAEAGTGAEFAREAAALMRAKSPTSLRIALRQMRLGAGLSFEQAMRTEYRIVSRVARGHDFYEGVRATIIDKDNAPRWRPPDLAGATDADIDAYFAPLERELDLG